jgi:diguanylate cyclase (GGDEF)-like protein
MGRRASGSRSASSRLFLSYASASLVLVAVLGAVLLTDYRADAARQGVEQGRAQAMDIAEMAIAPVLDDVDVSAGLTTVQRERLQGATDLAIRHGSVIRMLLRSFSGQVVFSADESTAAGISMTDPSFQAAAAGHTDVTIVADSRRSIGRSIRVLQPLIGDASGQTVGVLELYLPYETIAARLSRQLTVTYWRLGAGLLGLYLALALISWSTTRSLGRYAARQEFEAMHDHLTGLPNRAAFRARAIAALDTAARTGAGGAVVLVDLNRFKEVNDTLGHHAGDALLKVVATRLRAALRSCDTVGRLGGDEFGLILPGLTVDETLALLHTVATAVVQETVLDGVTLTIEASFGVALYPRDSTSVEELLQFADAALYQGKRGAVDVVLYTEGGAANPTHWLAVQAGLRHALARDELVLHYQPKVRLSDGTVSGVEALVRWQHPQRGLLQPTDFLPAAEQSGLIEPLTAWVLRQALGDHAGWTAIGQTWTVAVNVSARNLETPGFPQVVAGLLADTGVPAGQLLLEVTETALAGDVATAARTVVELTQLGVGIAIDDFGIGYTSLSQLRSLPVSEVKIDRAFVSYLDEDPQNQAIVRSVIALAHGLGCQVTAEGVETPQVAEWLAAAGCDEAQGYLFSRPVPWPSLSQLVTEVGRGSGASAARPNSGRAVRAPGGGTFGPRWTGPANGRT